MFVIYTTYKYLFLINHGINIFNVLSLSKKHTAAGKIFPDIMFVFFEACNQVDSSQYKMDNCLIRKVVPPSLPVSKIHFLTPKMSGRLCCNILTEVEENRAVCMVMCSTTKSATLHKILEFGVKMPQSHWSLLFQTT